MEITAAALLLASWLVSADPQVHRDLAYTEPKNERQTLDVYGPAEGKNHPIIFWIHGGGWQAGDKTDVQIKPTAFVEKGFVFVSTNYRLLPTVTIKQMARDIAKAIRWVHDHAGQYGGDPERIFVMGHSAGAQLAALVSTDDRYVRQEGLSFSIIQGCVPVDGDTYDVPMQIRTVEQRRADRYRGKFGDEASQNDLSPVSHVAKGKGIPSFLILHVADHPETKAQSQRLVKALQEVGVSAKAFPAEGKNHGTINADLGLPGDKPTQALFEFLSTLVGTATVAEPSRPEVSPNTKAAPQDWSAAGTRLMFLFSYFLGNGEDGLHLTSSRDGYHWTALNQGRSFLAPQAGHKLMRDPCLLRGPDGVFHLVWTTGWGDRVIGYASSRDLIHWSPQQAIPVMMHEPTARNAWAPELFYDDERKQFLIFWASTIPGRFLETDRTGDDGWNHRIYATTTRDFKTFTPTRLFFDGGFNVIDATILKARGQYYLIVKDETKTPVKKNLRIARSAKAEGPYRDVSAPISVSWVEGPSSIQMGDEFLIYFDHYAAPQYYGALRSKDLVHWENVSQKVKFPQGTRHGTVLRVSEEVVARLASASPKHFPPAASSKRSDYFPPSENEGGWRTLLPLSGLPNADEKAEIRQKAGMDWDKLAAAWEFNAKTEKPSGLLVIRHGYVVGEWYKDCDRKRDFNIYSSSKSYTSVAFGLLMADSRVGKLQGGRTLTRDTKVCNEQWLPESLPLSDPRRARITVGHLLHMVSGLGGQHVPAQSPFEWCFGHVPGSPMATLIGEPGTVFNYSNADVSHLTVLFHRAEGRDLFPFLKERLFDPIGIKQIRWEEIGGNGKIGPFSQAYSGIFTTPREHAKFCHLALNKGRWAGKQIVPEDYYDLAWRGTSVKPDYGELWWVYPHHRDAPKDLVQTLGANSNNGYIIPSLDLVFVRLGESDKLPAGSEPLDAGLLKRVLAAVANSSR